MMRIGIDGMVKISVVIPVYNEEKYIKETLESVKSQDFKDIEVILADNGSTDGTLQIARKVYPKIRVVVDTRLGFVGGLSNRGADLAGGELILFIDGDTSVTKDLMQAYYDYFVANPDVVAATGPIIPRERTTLGIRIGFKLVSVGLMRFFMLLGKPSIISSNLMVRAEAFRKVHGFNGNMKTYYDWDLSRRMKEVGRLAFVSGAVARTSVRRVKKWGMLRYFAYHASNVIVYNLFHRPRDDYEIIR